MMFKRNSQAKRSSQIFTASSLGKSVYVDAQELLEASKNQRDSIESVKFIPPRIGGKGFGRFRVQYKHPVYTVDSESEDENHDREFAHGL
ncbi:hypothetical protein [Morganella morganii]|uniref:hypothetical protein n=1 Tax=Morganella morganii TaxID=582 RepID=UPI00228A545F|nr:hypothetical protein [Morganella morganii]MDS0905950.1 hypothetical protein [Morganella morganii]HCT6470059.1 hypothetical protein [Morganella morganii]